MMTNIKIKLKTYHKPAFLIYGWKQHKYNKLCNTIKIKKIQNKIDDKNIIKNKVIFKVSLIETCYHE